MRIYKNCKDAASETKREVKEMGSEVKIETMQDKNIEGNPDYFTRELIGYSYMIVNPSEDKDEMLKAFGQEKNKEWAEEEFVERISQMKLNPGEAWKLRKEVWEEFIHDGEFSYTYSERMGDQIEKVIEELKIHPGSRQGIISIWDRMIDVERFGENRVPCTLFYQVIIRNGKLNMIYITRSNDVMTHWCFDIWLAISLQEYIASKLNVPVGNFYQFITSFHGYEKDLHGIF